MVGINAEEWETLLALWEQHPVMASEKEILSATASA
jgi:hypothetical protein